MPSKLPICRWTLDETLEFLLDIGAVVKNDNGYTSGWSEDMIQWTKNRACIAIAKKCGYHSKHTRTLRSLIDRVTEEFQIVWNYQGRWVFEKTISKEVSEMTGYDVDELNRRDWRRVVCYFSGLKRAGLSDEKIRERMLAYLPKVFNGVIDVRRCRVNARHARYDA
jgi:hypothetical protein